MQLNVTPDGEELLFAVWGPTTQGGDLWRARTDGSADAMPFVETPANEIIPQASPNGKWVAYGTDRAGPYGVAIRSLSATDSREWLISAAIDGFDPRWSPSGDAVYYRNANRLFRVEVGGDDDIDPGLVEVVYTGEFHDSAGSSYVLSADGTRVLLNRPSTTNANALVLVTNWVSEVVRAVSAASD
jgi:Tol biopolymer transport system component